MRDVHVDPHQVLQETAHALSRPLHEAADYHQHCIAHRMRGRAWQAVGNFALAEQHLTAALDLGTIHGFAARLQCAGDLAALRQAAGAPAAALLLHQQAERRTAAKKYGDEVWLVQSHLAAARCAMDLAQTEVARAELSQAEAWIGRTPYASGTTRIRSQVLLCAAEVAAHENEHERAADLMRRTQQCLEEAGPEAAADLLAVQVGLLQLALRTAEAESAYAMTGKLLEETQGVIQRAVAESDSVRREAADDVWGVQLARDLEGRLLLLQSRYCLGDLPLTGAAYAHLAGAAHLICNPVLRFKVLANLLIHALSHRDEVDQVFLHARIHNLRELLFPQQFTQLYREYVTNRYAEAAERRLDGVVSRLDDSVALTLHSARRHQS